MGRGTRLAWGAALALALIGGSARAEWVEASGPHVRVFSESSEEEAIAFAARLERFDQALRLLRNRGPGETNPSNRLTVYVLRDVGAVQRICGRGCSLVSGFYVPQASGSVAFTPRRSGGGAKLDLDAETVLFHEYTHHYLMQNHSAAYPAWFSEGFAEFNAAAQILDNGSIQVGQAAMHRLMGLLLYPISVRRLLATSGENSSWETVMGMYSGGWLLTHYLTFEPSRAGQINAYLDAINRGAPSLEAGVEAFGELRKLDRELAAYRRKPQIKTFLIPADKVAKPTVKIRRLGPGEAAMLPVRMRLRLSFKQAQAKDIAAEARRRAAPFGNDAFAQAVLAEAELKVGNVAAADTAATRALAADPNNFDALVQKGRTAMAIVAASTAATPETWKQARRWFVKANRIDPENAYALMLFYDSFAPAGERPTGNAVEGLKLAFALAPEGEELRWRMARHYLRDGDIKNARQTLRPLAFNPHADAATNHAAQLIAQIDAGATAEALDAAATRLAPDAAEDD